LRTSCEMVESRYQVTTDEDIASAVVRSVRQIVGALPLFVVTSFKLSINPIINPYPVSSH
jgi:hypothetical protein